MRIPEFLKPGRGGSSMISGSLVMFATIIGVGLLADGGYIDFGNETELVLETQALPRNGDVIPLEVAVQLINRRDEPLPLEAPTPCKVFKWVLTTNAREFVQAKPEEMCPQVVMTASLDANSNTTENFTLELDARRLDPEGAYELRVSYWGVEGVTAIEPFIDLDQQFN